MKRLMQALRRTVMQEDTRVAQARAQALCCVTVDAAVLLGSEEKGGANTPWSLLCAGA